MTKIIAVSETTAFQLQYYKKLLGFSSTQDFILWLISRYSEEDILKKYENNKIE
jgi:hypothetical protein